jgi:hypothetical protein
MHLGITITNILNCIFGRRCHLAELEEGIIKTQESRDKSLENDNRKKKKKKAKEMKDPLPEFDAQIVNVIKVTVNKYVTMKPKQVWEEIRRIAKARFNYELVASQLELEVFKFPFQKLATLREVCLCVGLVI